MTAGAPSWTMLTSVPTDTFLRVIVVCISPGSRIVELVGIANTLVWRQLEIVPAKRVTLARAEVGERHPVAAADPRVHLENLGGEAVGRKPFDHRVRIEEGTVDPLRCRTQDAVKPDGVGGRGRC